MKPVASHVTYHQYQIVSIAIQKEPHANVCPSMHMSTFRSNGYC